MKSLHPQKNMRALQALILASLLIPLSACVTLQHEPVYEQGSIDVVFCQEENRLQEPNLTQNCEEAFIAALDKASSIQCAFYDSDLENLTTTLLEKNADVLIFEENDKEAPPSWTRVKSSGLMHNKFCVLDAETNNARIITGSMNPTYNGAYRNDNNLAFITSQTLARNYLEEWQELKTRPGQYRTDTTEIILDIGDRNISIENYFCPEDHCEEKVLEELAQAQDSIYFMTFTFTSDPIGELILQKHASGVDVQGIFEKRQGDRYSEYTKLLEAGAEVYKDGNPYTMHHKVFIIDPNNKERATVITGSYNPTASANTKNDENILVIHDQAITQGYLAEFARVKSFSD